MGIMCTTLSRKSVDASAGERCGENRFPFLMRAGTAPNVGRSSALFFRIVWYREVSRGRVRLVSFVHCSKSRGVKHGLPGGEKSDRASRGWPEEEMILVRDDWVKWMRVLRKHARKAFGSRAWKEGEIQNVRARTAVRRLYALVCLSAFILSETSSAFAAGSTPYFPHLEGPEVESPRMNEVASKPAVLFIVVDTIRPDHLSAYGYPRPTSPYLKTLADEGVVFANHFSNSTWTKPSITSLFTGLFPGRNHVLSISSRLKSTIPTLAELFHDAGYKTGAIVGNKFAGRRYGLNRGFDRFAEPASHFNGESPSAKTIARLALRWIKKDADSPFFYTLFFFDPHDPYDPDQPYWDEFCHDCRRPLIQRPWREYMGRGPTPKQIADMKSLFDAEIRQTDEAIRSLIEGLEAAGLKDRLTVVVVGDHGEAFGEHRVFEHAFHIWDEVVRTPLIIRSPFLASRGVYTGLTQHVDLVPTLLNLAGLDIPESVQGYPLVVRSGQAAPPRDRLVITEVDMYGIRRFAIRDQVYKLIHHVALNEAEFLHYYKDFRIYPSVVRGRDKRELYNVLDDPFEKKDVYAVHQGDALRLERMLEVYRRTGGLEEAREVDVPSVEVMQDLKSLGYIQ